MILYNAADQGGQLKKASAKISIRVLSTRGKKKKKNKKTGKKRKAALHKHSQHQPSNTFAS